MKQWTKVICNKAATFHNQLFHLPLFQSKSILITTMACWVAIVLQIAVFPPQTFVSWSITGLDTILTLLLPLRTTQICTVILILHSVFLLLPADLTWASLQEFPALAFLTYRCSPACSIALVIWLTLLHVADSLINYTPSNLLWGALSFFPLCFIAFMGGSLRQFKQTVERRNRLIAQERAQRLERNKHLTTAIHDSITRELSAILLITGKWELNQGTESGRAQRDMQKIGAEARIALNQMHRVIDMIDDAHEEDRQTDNRNAVQALRELVNHERQSASAVGFDGSIHFTEQPGSSIDEVCLALVEGFLEEIFANILRHSQPGENSYSIDIAISQDLLHISQTNDVESGAVSVFETSDMRHGRGLQFHRQMIIDAGGTMQYSLHDGHWLLSARIPTKQR